MPQADILGFGPTLLVLPGLFLGGYFFFATTWAPRIMLTLRARAWVLSGLAGVFPSAGWPELTLMFIQFGALLWFVSRLTLVSNPGVSLPGVMSVPSRPVTLGTPLEENFFLLWGVHREGYLFRPAAAELTRVFGGVLGGATFFAPGRTIPQLTRRLRTRLSELPSGVSRG